MNDDAIKEAIARQFMAIPEAPPLVFEDQHSNPAAPFVMFDFVPVSRKDRSLQGGSAQSIGYVSFVIATQPNDLLRQASKIAQQIIDQFPARLMLPIYGGRVIIGDAMHQKSYLGGAHQMTPVRVDYATAKA